LKRRELEHVLRAAGAITGASTWVIVGSQAILGTRPDAPDALLVSEEVDLYAPDDPSASDLVDGSIGEKSPFHETFGYYAHGIGPETAILPSRWRDRAVSIRTPETAGVTGICPHPSDLAVAKLAAWPEKDREFVRALVECQITTVAEIQARLAELDPETAEQVRSRLRILGMLSVT
jgi:hypothetical protein